MKAESGERVEQQFKLAADQVTAVAAAAAAGGGGDSDRSNPIVHAEFASVSRAGCSMTEPGNKSVDGAESVATAKSGKSLQEMRDRDSRELFKQQQKAGFARGQQQQQQQQQRQNVARMPPGVVDWMAQADDPSRHSIQLSESAMVPRPAVAADLRKAEVVAGLWARDTRRPWGSGVGGRGSCLDDAGCVFLMLFQVGLLALTAGTVVWAVRHPQPSNPNARHPTACVHIFC